MACEECVCQLALIGAHQRRRAQDMERKHADGQLCVLEQNHAGISTWPSPCFYIQHTGPQEMVSGTGLE
eukprot:3025582-Amphidinium_carterae.1